MHTKLAGKCGVDFPKKTKHLASLNVEPFTSETLTFLEYSVSGIHSSRTLNLFLVSSLLKANLDNYFYLILVTTNFLINPLVVIMNLNINMFYDLFSMSNFIRLD